MRLVGFALLAVGLTTPSWAINVSQGSTLAYKASCLASMKAAGPFWTFVADPLNLEGFQLDVTFDPSVFAFVSLEFIDPYVQAHAPDLSQLSAGVIGEIGGTSSTFPPPPGEVDIFQITFQQIAPLTPTASFGVSASSNDFAMIFDSDTGQVLMSGPQNCIPCSVTAAPEPSSSILLALGIAFYVVVVELGEGRVALDQTLRKLRLRT